MKVSGKKTSAIMVYFVLLITLGTILFTPVQGYARTSRKIEGIWQGTLKFSGVELQIIITISRSPKNTLTAAMDVPAQNAVGIPVDEIIFSEGKLHFEIIPIQGIFEGQLTEDRAKIDGHWTQGGERLPLVFERSHEKPVIKRPQEPAEPFPYRSEEVVFKKTTSGVTLAGTLTMPPSEGLFPALLLLSGTGPQDRDEAVFGHRPFLVLADYLTRIGIAVLRVDDRGVGGSTGDFDQATAVDYFEDALAGVAYLKSRKEIDQRSIGLLGHSEGGMIAAMAAAQSSDIAFIVLVASPGLPIREMEHSERARTLKANNASDDLMARSRAMQNSLFSMISRETDSKVVQDEFTAIITEFFKGLSAEERKITGISEDNLETYIQDQFRRLHSPWFRFYLPYDPGVVLQEVTCPVLAVNGDKDVQVVSKENLAAIEKALTAGGNKNFTIKELPRLNHLMQTAETGRISEYAKIEETMSPAALRIIGDWILGQVMTREKIFSFSNQERKIYPVFSSWIQITGY